MDKGIFLALLNPVISVIFGSVFVAFWLQRRNQHHLVVLTLSYVCCGLGFLLQYFTLPPGLEFTRLISNTGFTVGAVTFAGAIAQRYRRPVPTLALAVLGISGMASFSWFLFVQPDLTWRMYVINFALGGILLVVTCELRAVSNKGPFGQLLMWTCFMMSMSLLVRPVAMVWAEGPYVNYEEFFASAYWITMNLAYTLFSILSALALVSMTALDVYDELRRETQTDPLTGLLNRRGFETAAETALHGSAARGIPVCVVIADLDHFKSVNDTFGHACGDNVISAFAGFLREAVGQSHVAGRIGGEEFAVIMPGSGLAAARLFAEAARSSFSVLPVSGLPDQCRFTASFGVAELEAGESAAELLRRADEALYQAKRDGRDCVRIWSGVATVSNQNQPAGAALAAGI